VEQIAVTISTCDYQRCCGDFEEEELTTNGLQIAEINRIL